jgi:ATP-binding cassette subfamily B protein/ATP-binding cassette subfamily C protein
MIDSTQYNSFYTLLIANNKKKLFILVLFSLIYTFIEVIGISVLMPFISIIANPDILHENKYYNVVYKFFNFKSSNSFLLAFGYVLILFYIFRGFFSVFNIYFQNKFAMNKYYDISNNIFNKYIYMSYQNYVQQNSAILSKIMTSDTSNLSFVIQFCLIFISEFLIILIFYSILLFVDLYITLFLTIFFIFVILILLKFVSIRVEQKGQELIEVQEKRYKIINETLGNFKFMKFSANESKVYRKFKNISSVYKNIYISNNVLSEIPRIFIESIGFSLIVGIIIIILNYTDDSVLILPMITMYALAFYRILPAVTRLLTSYNGIIFYLASLKVVYKNTNIKNIKEYDNKIKFNNSIKARNIAFSYTEKNTILNDINLTVKVGQKIAFIGESGSGKSSLVDLICGIYRPNSGKILIDDVELDNSNIVSWRKKIGYIPQSIYLFDGTIAQNISFGRDYNKEKIVKVLKQANIYNTLMQKDGLDTMVGEGGIQLSGGQKQRIGIARALYGDPEILVLDEATSALDTDIEKAIMDEIYKISEDKTLMIIAHRLSTIEKCDIKVDLTRINNND